MSCKKEPERIYELNAVDARGFSGNKTKPKTKEQYISILYTNLFQTALSGNQLVQIINSMESIGDKELAREVIISNFMNQPGVILPSNDYMRNETDSFLDETYERFFVRKPTEAERQWFKNFLQSNPQVTAELVYYSFALSDEYLFY
ncbi:MAG: hypothetical protein ACK4GL_09790 [Flavobacteriales bacterium]